MAKPSTLAILRRRKYRRLLALLCLTALTLTGMTAYAGLATSGYQVRVLPVDEWFGRERSWGITIHDTDPLRDLQSVVSMGTAYNVRKGYYVRDDWDDEWRTVQANYPTVRERRIYRFGILAAGTAKAFQAAAIEKLRIRMESEEK
jgi:hypothetical protein